MLNLKSTGLADPSINKLLLLKSTSMPKDTETKPSYEKQSSNSKRKPGWLSKFAHIENMRSVKAHPI